MPNTKQDLTDAADPASRVADAAYVADLAFKAYVMSCGTGDDTEAAFAAWLAAADDSDYASFVADAMRKRTPVTFTINITETAKQAPGKRVLVMVRNDNTLGDGGRIEQARMIKTDDGWRDELYDEWFVERTHCLLTFGPDVLAALVAGNVVVR